MDAEPQSGRDVRNRARRSSRSVRSPSGLNSIEEAVIPLDSVRTALYSKGYKMPPVDRNNPKRAKSSDSRVSFMEFMREYPDDATCLEFLWRTRYAEDGEHAECPCCEQPRPFKRYETAQ